MASRNGKTNDPPGVEPMSITVGGFKSIAREQTVEIRPLTILAGANSSGKSSLMQAVLLLKQTLEATYDPGAMLINGPNVRFTQVEQMISACLESDHVITVGLQCDKNTKVILRYLRNKSKRLDVVESVYGTQPSRTIRLDMTADEIKGVYPKAEEHLFPLFKDKIKGTMTIEVVRDRCYLAPHYSFTFPDGVSKLSQVPEFTTDKVSRLLRGIIHLPGLRGNPERAYPITSTGPEFAGTFEPYTASIIREWSESKNVLLNQLGDDLKTLGLTWKVTSEAIDDARVELRVGRLPKPKQGGARDLVNIADVGFGVSQTLPVVVALLVAKSNQILYIEQPEIHLHPGAQVAMGKLLANSANRGVRVIIETHSSLLLLGVQSQIADGHLDPKRVKLHWFNRSETDGSTEIVSANVDDEGRFPGWPEDFDDVSLEAQQHYMDAVEKRQVAG